MQGHKVTLFNRGKTANRPLPGESEADFQDRIAKASFIKGDRTNVDVRSTACRTRTQQISREYTPRGLDYWQPGHSSRRPLADHTQGHGLWSASRVD
jgi:hypothetical protein